MYQHIQTAHGPLKYICIGVMFPLFARFVPYGFVSNPKVIRKEYRENWKEKKVKGK